MSYFKKLQSWLSEIGISSSETPVSHSFSPIEHSVIERSDDFNMRFNNWILNGGKSRVISEINEILVKSNYIDQNMPGFTILKSPGANGFQIDLEESDEDRFQNLIDYLKEQVKELDYVCYNSDQRIYEKSFGLESIYRHYLKPRLRHNDSLPFNQQFGNILIELYFKNEKASKFKFLVTYYSDSKFDDPLPFKDLIQVVFK